MSAPQYPVKVISFLAIVALGLPIVAVMHDGTAALAAWATGALLIATNAWLCVKRQLASGLAQARRAEQTLQSIDSHVAQAILAHNRANSVLLAIGSNLDMLFGDGIILRDEAPGHSRLWLRTRASEHIVHTTLAVRSLRGGVTPAGAVLIIFPGIETDDELTHTVTAFGRELATLEHCHDLKLPAYIAVYHDWSGRMPRAKGDNAGFETPPVILRLPDGPPHEHISHIEHASRFIKQDIPNECAATALADLPILSELVAWTLETVTRPLSSITVPSLGRNNVRVKAYGWLSYGSNVKPGSAWDAYLVDRVKFRPPDHAPTAELWPPPVALVETEAHNLRHQTRTKLSLRARACMHAVIIVAIALTATIWGIAMNDIATLEHIRVTLDQWHATPPAAYAERQTAVASLLHIRKQLLGDTAEGFSGPLLSTAVSLGTYSSLGVHRNKGILRQIDNAIAAYKPRPVVVLLDMAALFRTSEHALRPDCTPYLQKALSAVEAHPQARILVAGHTDNVGEPDTNAKLSLARAEAVRDWLVRNSHVSVTHFAVQGWGASHPFASNDTEQGRTRNRRVEITFIEDSPEQGLPQPESLKN